MKKSAKARACDIPQDVKEKVWERDNHRCVICGDTRAFPNAHFVPRSAGGLGIERNIVTLCSNFAPNHCHYTYDFGSKTNRTAIRKRLKEYLQSKYPDWDEKELVYKRW